MKQKQRGSDKQKPKVKVTLKAKEIEIKGKKVELEPLIKKVAPKFENIPKRVSEVMGVALIIPEIEFLIFDNEGFKKYVSEIDESEYTGEATAIYWPGRKDIAVDVSTTDKFAALFPDAESISDIILLHVAINSMHEVAHMIDYYYDDNRFKKTENLGMKYFEGKYETEERIKEISKKKWVDIRLRDVYDFCKLKTKYTINKRHYFRYLRGRTLAEGIAVWTEREIFKRVGNDFRKSGDIKIAEVIEWLQIGVHKPIEPIKNIDLSKENEHAFGYRFFEKISQMTDANVIRLAIDYNPTYVEMLYPELYILRMKASLLM